MGFNTMPAEGPWTLQDFAGLSSGGGGSAPNTGPATITKIAGDQQAVATGQAFPLTLRVQVLDINGSPVGGDTVIFTILAGPSGASATFPGGAASVQALTDSNGFASSPVFTANGTAGGFSILAAESIAGLSTFFGETSNPPVVAPSAPTGVAGTQVSATSASVAFTDGDNGGAAIDGYMVRIYKDTVLVDTLPATGLFTVANPLTVTSAIDYVATHSYQWSVAAHNNIGLGSFSALSPAVVWTAPPVALQSMMRGLFINQAASTILAQTDVAGYELVCVQPTQIAGYTAAKNGTKSLNGAPTMAQIRAWASAPAGVGIGPIVIVYINSANETGFDRSTPAFWTPYGPSPNWYLYNAAGQKILAGTTSNVLMAMITNLSGASVRWGKYQNAKAQAIAADTHGWNGIFWDVLSIFSNHGSPIDPLRGGVYTTANFNKDLAFLGAALQAGLGFDNRWFVGNSLTSAAKYGFNANGSKTTSVYNAGSQQILATPIFSGMVEAFCRGSADKLTDFPGIGGNSTGTYAQLVAMVDDVCRVKGGAFYGITKIWIATNAGANNQWQRIMTAVGLLGEQAYGSCILSFELSSSDTGNYPMLAPVIGNPSDLTRPGNTTGKVFYRAFSAGYVFLNTDSVDHATPIALPVSVPGHWTDTGPTLAGTTGGNQYADGSTPTVPKNNALILRNY